MKNPKGYLSQEIFNQSYEDLDPGRKEFVDFQAGEFHLYRKKVREALLKSRETKKISSYEYNIIDDFFVRRVPINCVLLGIEKGTETAEIYKTPIFSIGFFRPHIYVEYKAYKKHRLSALKQAYSERSEKGLDPWFFVIWKDWKNGNLGKLKFDPYYGYCHE